MNTPNNNYGLESSNKNEVSSFNVSDVLCNNRYCNQDDFHILICGGLKDGEVLRNCFLINPSNFAKTKQLPPMLEPRHYCKTAVVSSDIFVAGGYSSKRAIKSIKSIEMFSHKNKVWKNIDLLSIDPDYFCVCSFNKKLYIIGSGIIEDVVQKYTCCCRVYDVKTDKWSQIACTNAFRCDFSACTVFEGKIVVTVGYDSGSSVEAFDHHENKWSYLPPMVGKRYGHDSVSMGNKMFVIGGKKTSTCELFDSRSRKFVILKQDSYFRRGFFQSERAVLNSVCIGNKIIVFIMTPYDSRTTMCIFDVFKQNWLYCDSKICAEYSAISCVRYPMQ